MPVLGKTPRGRAGEGSSRGRWSLGVPRGLWGSGHFRVTLPPHTGTLGQTVPKRWLEHFLRLLTPKMLETLTLDNRRCLSAPSFNRSPDLGGVGPKGLQLLHLLSLECDTPGTLMAGRRKVA